MQTLAESIEQKEDEKDNTEKAAFLKKAATVGQKFRTVSNLENVWRVGLVTGFDSETGESLVLFKREAHASDDLLLPTDVVRMQLWAQRVALCLEWLRRGEAYCRVCGNSHATNLYICSSAKHREAAAFHSTCLRPELAHPIPTAAAQRTWLCPMDHTVEEAFIESAVQSTGAIPLAQRTPQSGAEKSGFEAPEMLFGDERSAKLTEMLEFARNCQRLRVAETAPGAATRVVKPAHLECSRCVAEELVCDRTRPCKHCLELTFQRAFGGEFETYEASRRESIPQLISETLSKGICCNRRPHAHELENDVYYCALLQANEREVFDEMVPAIVKRRVESLKCLQTAETETGAGKRKRKSDAMSDACDSEQRPRKRRRIREEVLGRRPLGSGLNLRMRCPFRQCNRGANSEAEIEAHVLRSHAITDAQNSAQVSDSSLRKWVADKREALECVSEKRGEIKDLATVGLFPSLNKSAAIKLQKQLGIVGAKVKDTSKLMPAFISALMSDSLPSVS